VSQIGVCLHVKVVRGGALARIMTSSLLCKRGVMNSRCLLASLLLVVTTSHAADGLSTPRLEGLWPQWQARVHVHTASLLPFGVAKSLEVKGGAVLGDYLLAQPSFGVFRATGGIVAGSLAGAPLYKALPGQAPGLFVQGHGLQPALLPVTDSPQPLPYLGLGFSSAPLGSGFSISADLGLVSQNPGSSVELGRALLGNQGVERAFRELRLSPMAQLSVRYAF
jgi:hypothetical protein